MNTLLAPGTKLVRYDICSKIGDGGMVGGYLTLNTDRIEKEEAWH
jgi:hypothetical protein